MKKKTKKKTKKKAKKSTASATAVDYKAERRKLLSARTPEKYIEKTLDSKLSRGLRAKITKEWLDKTSYTIEDIQYARNRHPYWKKKKSVGSQERQNKRLEKFNFRAPNAANLVWTNEKLQEFLSLNSKMVDHELAKHFETTLPAVNHIRRKIKIVEKILEAKRKKPTAKQMIPLLKRAEKNLKNMLTELVG